jgi:hypothetical protein
MPYPFRFVLGPSNIGFLDEHTAEGVCSRLCLSPVWQDNQAERQRKSSHCREAHAPTAVPLPAMRQAVHQQGFQWPREQRASDVEGHRL